MRLVRFLMSKKGAKVASHKPHGSLRGEDDGYTWKLSGMTWKDMKKHYSIIPIYGMTIVAACMAGAYVFRLATKHPEVAWTKKSSEPWQEYKNRQYKFLSSGRDYPTNTPPPPVK